MRALLLFLVLFSVPLGLTAQTISGVVTSSVNATLINGVHIVNTSANKMAISDEEGHFKIVANAGDTLVASNVNFNTKQFILNSEKFLKISLNPAVVQLEEVRVSNIPDTEAEFRKKLIGMGEVEDETFVPFGMTPSKPKGKIPKNYDPSYTKSLGYAINKPISFIVKKLSKEHKNKLKYYQTVANKGNVIANSKKYNPEIVKELTGLEGDQLTDFIEYLDMDPAFVKRSSEYEIAARILKEFDYYQSKSQKG